MFMLGGAAGKLAVLRDGVSLPVATLGLSVFITTAGFFTLLATIDASWDAWTPATCLAAPRGCFCERPRKHTLVLQPANTFSNLIFTVTGAVILVECVQQQMTSTRKRAIHDDRLGVVFGVLFGLSNVILGAGSGWYHASLTLHGQWIDNAAMYLLASAPALFSLASLRVRGGWRMERAVSYFVAEYVTVNAALGWLCLAVPDTRRYIFLVLLVVLMGCEARARAVIPGRAERAPLRPLVMATLTFGVAFAIWTLDIRGIVCDPDSLLQGHAAWHLLCGVASFQMYLYFHALAFTQPPGTASARQESALAPTTCSLV